MFFSDFSQIEHIVTAVDSILIALPAYLIADFPGDLQTLKNALIITPDKEKSVITIDQIREILSNTTTQQSTDQFFIIKHAELMNEPAANAFLKTLEEPGTHYHFILLTPEPTRLLPTIRSRVQNYTYHNPAEKAPIDPTVLDWAKKLITTTGPNLVDLADEISKKPKSTSKKSKKGAPESPRILVLKATAMAIELLTQAYLKTSNKKLLKRLKQLINLHHSITLNGHLKLQIIACLSAKCLG